MEKNANATQGWKKMRKTKHTHDPLDDAMGMAEAILEIKKRGLIRIDAIPDEIVATRASYFDINLAMNPDDQSGGIG